MEQRLFSMVEIYTITVNGFLGMGKFIKGRKKNLLSQEFVEHIMLAVTAVNDCSACSYGHTKMFLEIGMSPDEIRNILAGQHSDVQKKELPAIMFAQHYAESRGLYSQESHKRITDLYGQESHKRITDLYSQDKAKAILGSIRMIMMGNAYGISWGSFIKRFKGQADPRSHLLYELAVVILSFVFIPLALIQAFIMGLYQMIFRKN